MDRASISTTRAALALALLLGLQPLTTDLYLPALPTIARELQAPMAATQLTMSALILGFGLAQLAWGPVADRFGRRPVLLIGLALYTTASVLCALAADIGVLILGRTLQGACLAAMVVCGRAMVRDLYEPRDGAHVMSRGMTGLGLIAIGAPALGGLLTGLWGWRAPLAAVAAVGIGIGLFVWRFLPETLPRRNPQALRIGPLAAQARRVLGHPTFVAWAALSAATYGGLFTILAASSFVYIGVLGLSPAAYGLAMATGSLSYLVGTVLCRRWLPRLGLAGTVRRGASFTLAGGLGMAALALAGVQSVWALVLPQALYTFGHGIHQPCGQTGAVGPFPQAAGVAAALAGCLLALTAFCVGLWLGQALDGTVRPLALGVAGWSVVTAGIAWTLVRRHGEASAVPAQAAGDVA
ncbi:multidrug effflux MFS transporter [Ideonella sp. BN130291]|uniref:multidrug effflux MFS transporter n=1 Tax=Ideonella sp. BN130291 TaxID=3112940 RepID=UPI002E2672B9|nr:multidrug effflux MFS transporter [Ideonella sp. BN130291]